MRIIALTLALVLAAPLAADAAQGADRPYPVKIVWKLGRGIMNVVGSPMEVPSNSYLEGNRALLSGGNTADQLNGLFTGTITGIGYMVARIGVGVLDIVTFPIPSQPLMTPGAPNWLLEVVMSPTPPHGVTEEAPAETFMPGQ